jgi:hypothetical protein
MAHVEKFESALEELVDFRFANFVRSEKRVKVKVRKAAISDARGEKFAEAAGFDGAERANFFEDDAAKRILKNGSVEQPANFGAGTAFDEHGTQEAQSVAFQKVPTVLWMRNHRSPAINLP